MWSANSSPVACFCLILVFIAFTANCNGQDNQTLVSTETSPWLLVADPPKLERITEMTPYTVNLTLTYTEKYGDPPSKYAASPESFRFVVKVSMSNRQTVALGNNQEIEFTWNDIADANKSSKTMELTGRVIGYVDLKFILEILPANHLNDSVVLETFPVLSGYLVTVVRASETLDTAFTM